MTLLPNCCAVYATAAAALLDDHNVRTRILDMKLADGQGRHCVCLFSINGRLRAYDRHGTKTLPKKLTLNSAPKTIARVWLHLCACKKDHPKKLQARWY